MTDVSNESSREYSECNTQKTILIEELEKKLSELNSHIEKFKKNVGLTELVIIDKKLKLKKEIEMVSKDLIDYIEKLKEDLLVDLDNLVNTNLQEVKNTMGSFIVESNLKFNEINEYIKDTNSERLRDATESASNLIENITRNETLLIESANKMNSTLFKPNTFFSLGLQIGTLIER